MGGLDEAAAVTETLVDFPPLRGRGGAEARRRALVRSALVAHVERAQTASLGGAAWDRGQGWRADFDVEAVEAPEAARDGDGCGCRVCAGAAAPASARDGQAPAGDGPAPDAALPSDPPLLAALKRLDWYEGQVAHVDVVPARAARYTALGSKLPPAAAALLGAGGRRLYTHQAAAIDAALGGAHVGLCTGTASGKSLAYTVPALCAAVEAHARACVALFLFPTKALAQDQVGALEAAFETVRCAGGPALHVAALDGDTPWGARAAMAAAPPSVIITNPDMLHYTILPSAEWARTLATVRYVVVDEAHVYVGGFGSHVAAVLRRLRRCRDAYAGCGAPPLRFFCCSATIANPREHFGKLVPISAGEALVVVDDDASPKGEQCIVVWNPPAMRLAAADGAGGGAAARAPPAAYARRKSSIVETAKLFAALVSLGVRTLAFGRTRKLVELILAYTRGMLRDAQKQAPPGAPRDLAARVQAYRAGYTIEARRRIERDFFGGGLAGVVATCALELGIDVGDLDATLHLGHPNSAAALRQQAGRAGRSGRPSLAIVVCWDAPLDQMLSRGSAGLATRAVEPAALELANECVLRDHLVCAAAELPLVDKDRAIFAAGQHDAGPAYDRCLTRLVADGMLVVRANGSIALAHGDASTAARAVNLRMIDPVTFVVLRAGEAIDSVPYSRAFYELYEGAIYLHQAQPHRVIKLDLWRKEAIVEPLAYCNYLTSARNHTDVDPQKYLDTTAGAVSTGCVDVVSKVWGFRQVCRRTGRILEVRPLHLPELRWQTRGTWIDLSPDCISAVAAAGRDLLCGIHAVNHALCAVTPLLVLCDAGDVATEHAYPLQQRPRPHRVIVYDARPGGLGIADALFRRIDAALAQALAAVASCPCREDGGCPACLHDPRCGAQNVALDRVAAQMILEHVVRERRAQLADEAAGSPRRRPAPGGRDSTPRKRRHAEAKARAGFMDLQRGRGVHVPGLS
ncbi:P-loop containing nucleoside triphosphate hydrolase protein [Pelagophyceae sp. CCMP2097]|nr:P-loop containing nucleoside triphosphate hydrolase protein [Pelagophyceae sp. CCMP2097]